jgi:hypothetical protein
MGLMPLLPASCGWPRLTRQGGTERLFRPLHPSATAKEGASSSWNESMDLVIKPKRQPLREADARSLSAQYGWEHTLFVLPSVGRLSQTSFRQVLSRNPVFLNQTTGARSWIPAQKRRRNDETGDHPFLSTNGVCSHTALLQGSHGIHHPLLISQDKS